MDDAKLVRMANQIAQAFAADPEAQAIEEVRDHLRKFWDPRMRRQILTYRQGGGGGLLPLAMAAVDGLGSTPAAD